MSKENRKREQNGTCGAATIVFVLLCVLSVTTAICASGQQVVSGEATPEVAVQDLFDPFAYHVQGEHGDSFTPADSGDMPKGIRVLAIMQAKGGPPHAVLQIANDADPVFVTENDVVRVENLQRSQVARGPKAGAAVTIHHSDEPVYLRIHTISHNSVEISPQKRPQEIHIFQ